MTSQERIMRMFQRREADRVPIIDIPWAGTIRRWHREGMPDMDWRDYFEVDRICGLSVDNSPRFEQTVVEQTETYEIVTTQWGVTLKNFKALDSTPEFIDFTVTNPAAWEKAKARMLPSEDRLDLAQYKKIYEEARARGDWVQANFWFGFDVTHSWMVGTETLLVAMIEDPDWVRDMFERYLDVCIALHQRLWDEGIRADAIRWPDDMGYKQNQFFSLRTYRELLAPYHKKAIDWAHDHGMYACLHSCGDVRPFVPEFVAMGLDALNPLEVKAGMDPVVLKRQYGDKLLLNGGINAVLWDKPDLIREEITRVVPVLKENGGYIFSSDHSIPNSVSLEDFRQIVALVKKL